MPDLKRELPDWIDAFMMYTDNSEPPTMFRKWTAISTIASAMQRKVRIDWGPAMSWFPNMYIILVGKSATGKGTAMGPALDLLHDVPTIKLAANATSLQALIKHLKETNCTDIDMETGSTVLHSSLTIFSKEFTVFLGYHNRELMAALCDWYDCDRRWSYETISRKKEEILGVWVNLIGATTPDLVQSSLPMDSIGGGLTSRIIFICEDKPAKMVPLPTITGKEIRLRELLLHDLEKISMLSGSFSWTDGFSDMWVSWCHKCNENPPFYNSKFDGYLGRRRLHAMKLAMIISASHGKHDLVLKSDDLEEAIKWLIEAETNMEKVFRGVGKGQITSLINQAVVFIVNSKTTDIPVWQFARHFKDDMDKFTMDRVINTLESMKMVTVIKRPGTDDIIKVLDTSEKSV